VHKRECNRILLTYIGGDEHESVVSLSSVPLSLLRPQLYLFLPAASGKASRKWPNVLYVFSDQHRAQSLPGERFNQAMAPTPDRFRGENLSMDACISNYPLSAPHRAILVSGLYSCQSRLTQDAQTLEPVVPGLRDTFQKAASGTSIAARDSSFQRDHTASASKTGTLGSIQTSTMTASRSDKKRVNALLCLGYQPSA
jgi:hypothetical protein